MRDHSRLRAFALADELAVQVYRATQGFPREEQFGLTAQMRRAAVSVASNIVEGCARRTQADYLHFLEMAYASLKELEYQINLSHRLSFLKTTFFEPLSALGTETSKVLAALIRSLRLCQRPPQ
jgi:four helix bundle protein